MSEELHELQEHAEHAKHDPSLAPATLTMAIFAVLVATVSLLGHRTSIEEVVLQNRVTDQWGYYQAKNIRRHSDEQLADLTTVIATKDPEAATKLQEKYRAEAERYRDEQKELDAKAKEFADIVKIGRTHLQDATPLTVEQEFSGWVSLLDRDLNRITQALDGLYDLAIGGTAVGTGLNAHPEFAERAARKISELSGVQFL